MLAQDARISAEILIWHASCKDPGIGGTVPPPTARRPQMTARFTDLARPLFTVVAAFTVAAMMVGAAVPVLPIA
jgi:hypothetical protein